MKEQIYQFDQSVAEAMSLIPIPFGVKDAEGRFRYVNDALARALGRPPGEVVGRTDTTFLSEKDVRCNENALKIALREGKPSRSDITLYTQDGWRSFAIAFFPVAAPQQRTPPVPPNGKEPPERMVMCMAHELAPGSAEAGKFDVSDLPAKRDAAPDPLPGGDDLWKEVPPQRHSVEEYLRRSRQTERAMLDATSDLVLMYDMGGTILEVNQAYARRLGRTRQQLVGRRLFEVLPRERLAARYADTRRVMQTHRPERGVYAQDGIFEQYVLYPLLDSNGSPERFVLFIHDITELKRQELDLRKLRVAMEHAGVAVVILDARGRVEFVNSQYSSMTGLSLHDVAGKTVSVLRPWRLGRVNRQALRAAARAGTTWHGELFYRRRDAKGFWADCSMTPVPCSPEGDMLYVLVGKDITERKQLEEIRENAERVVRHNLKSPLNTIINAHYLLANTGELNGEQREYLKLADDAGRRILRQLNMSLTLFHMELGTYTFSGESLDAVEVLDRAVQAARFRAERVGVELRLLVNGTEGADSELFILAEPECFACLVDNLLENALEASRPGQRVDVAVDELEGGKRRELSIRFANSSVVPEPVRSRFFEKYATYGKRHGTGLGTYSARLITHAMGGSITMRSGEGCGTCVEVRFPRNTPGVPAQERKSA
jgi:PAS domain S-box-containing protein